MTQNEVNQLQWQDLKTAAALVNLSTSTLRTAMNAGELKFRRSKGKTGKILTTTEWVNTWILSQQGGQNG